MSATILDITQPVWGGLLIGWLIWLPTLDARPILLFLLLWIVVGWRSKSLWRPTPLDICWGIWLLLIPLTLWATALPEKTLAALRLFIAQGMAFWTWVAWIRTPRRAMWGMLGTLMAGSVLAGLGFFWLPDITKGILPRPQWLLLLHHKGNELPIPPQKVNANVLAGVLLPVWGLGLGVLGALRSGWWRLGYFLALPAVSIVGLILLLTESRGVWVSAVWAVYFLLSFRWPWLWGGAVWGGLIALLLIWQIFPGAGVQQWGRIATHFNLFGTFFERLEIWNHSLYALQDFSITGIGMGTYGKIVPLLYPFALYSSVPHAHNLFLQVGIDLGFPGLLAFLAAIFNSSLLGSRGVRVFQNTQRSDLAWLIRGAGAGLLAALMHGFVDAVTWNTRPAFLVWAIWGGLIGVGLLAVERDKMMYF